VNLYLRLSAAVLKTQPATAARVFENFPPDLVARFLATTSPANTGQIVGHFTPVFAANLLAALEPAAAGRVFDHLPPDYQILLLRQLEHGERDRLLQEMEPERAASIRRLLPYPDGTAGALMEAPLASVPDNLSVRNALKRVKRIRYGMKFYLYATDDRGVLTGVLTLHQLLNAPSSSRVGEIMQRQVVTLTPMMSLRSVFDSPYWQEYHALPVIDDRRILLGVIRQKSVRRFEEQTAQADAVGMGLDTALAVGEMFSVTAAQLLSALIDAGGRNTGEDSRG
jgi:magnesium transporter